MSRDESVHSMTIPITCSAAACLVRQNVGIRFVERMAELAVRLGGVTPIRALGLQACLALAFPLAAAGAAHPLPVFCDVHVIAQEDMTIDAVSFPCMVGGRVGPAQDVSSLRHRVEMGGVYTQGVAAQMIEYAAFGQGTVSVLPCPSVGTDLFTAARQAKVAISPAVAQFRSRYPLPASPEFRNYERAGFIDLGPESLAGVSVCHTVQYRVRIEK